MGVMNAHGDLEEEVYMDILPDLSCQKTKCKVYKLKKALHDVKQSPKVQFGRFVKGVIAFGYQQSNVDRTIFIKHFNAKINILLVYVDDIVITGNDSKQYPI